MRTRSFFKIVPAALMAALLGLAAAGLTLAHWQDQVKVSGSMTMGHLEWDLTPTALGWNTNTVMEFDIDVDYPGDGPGETGLLAVDVDNAYPNAYGAILIIVRNEGSIPVHVTFWVEPEPSCSGDLLDYLLLNPAYDAPHYNGEFDYSDYSIADISSGWTDPWTHPVSWWTSNHGTPSTALAIEDVMASGKILKLPDTSITIMEYDDDNIIMPGEKSAIFLWLGVSDDMQDREDLMGASCSPAFYIHYYAVQAVP